MRPWNNGKFWEGMNEGALNGEYWQVDANVTEEIKSDIN